MPVSSCETCSRAFSYHRGSSEGRFCSYECSGLAHRKRTMEKFERGEIKKRDTLRRVMTEAFGYECSVCSISSWQGKPITLQVDHIDGDASNNMPANLRLICPNCHSQTETWCGKNVGKGRKSRGLQQS